MATVISPPPAVHLLSFPTELLVNIITMLPWSGARLRDTKLVCQRFNDILIEHEHAIASNLIVTHFPQNSKHRFPGLFIEAVSYKTAGKTHNRWKVLDGIRGSCCDIRERDGKTAVWMTPRWIRVQEVGLCLLYRIQDCSCYEEQTTLLKTLPSVSLAVLLFTLMMSIHQLRADGPEIIHHHSPVQIAAFRAEVELACEELMLQHGPDYLALLLSQDAQAVKTLEKEYESMESRQLPYSDGKCKPLTLISVLGQALSARLGCQLKDNYTHMWDILQSDRLKDLGEEEAEQIINEVCV